MDSDSFFMESDSIPMESNSTHMESNGTHMESNSTHVESNSTHVETNSTPTKSSSSAVESSSTPTGSTKKKKSGSSSSKKWYMQKFKPSWLIDPEFEGWLREDPNDSEFSFCKVCNVSLKNANKSALRRHKQTTKHRFGRRSVKSEVDLDVSDPKTSIKKTSKVSKISEQVVKSESVVASFFSEHNIPFSQADDFFAMCRRAFPDSRVASKLAKKRPKLAYVIQYGISYLEESRVDTICKTQNFSVFIDESIDISGTHSFSIVIRIFDKERQDVADALLDRVLVEYDTIESLYAAVKMLLQDRDIPLRNIIGLGSDNCDTLMAVNHDFQRLLKADVPHIFFMDCACHTFALCASYAVSVLPSYLESLLKDLSHFLSRNTKPGHEFATVLEAIDAVAYKILKLKDTNWLSRELVVSAVIEKFDALLEFFQTEESMEHDAFSVKICDALSNAVTMPMLLFLQYALGKMNRLNMEFQSEHFRLHELYANVSAEYRKILECFIKDEVLEKNKLSKIDTTDARNYKHVEDIYLGGRTMAYLLKNPFNEHSVLIQFKSDCLKFLVEVSSQIKSVFDFDEDGVLAKLNILNPKTARNQDVSPTSIASLAMHFPTLVNESQLNQLDNEWQNFRTAAADPELKFTKGPIPQYWNALIEISDGLGNPKYGLLSHFMTCLTCLPHASASVARIFSQ